MFDEVTKREGGQRAAKRGAWVIASSALQAVLVVAIVVVSSKIAADVADAPVVDVKFVKTAAPPPPPPPPPAARPKTPPKPKTDAPKKPPNPMAMVQPKEIAEEMKPPDPNEPPEPEYETSDEGVEGGVIGGVVGSTTPGPGGGGGFEDAPAYATAGYRKPEQIQRGCVQSSIRLPSEVLDNAPSSVTVKFAIGRDGAPSLFEVMGAVRDSRISNAIWQAVRSCKWNPGADAQGRPTKLWVILPIRFDIN